jgi:pimeloyl-ACP methyl ester carboxylesterase
MIGCSVIRSLSSIQGVGGAQPGASYPVRNVSATTRIAHTHLLAKNQGERMTSYRTIEADGTEIFYREAGDRSSPTLLLLHGFPSSSAQYDQLMHRLAGRYHVIAPDYPGFGRSPALTGTTSFDRLADVVDAFIETESLGRFSLYGNAYEVGLGPGMQALEPYWRDRAGNEAAVRGFLTLDVTRSQYVDGVPDSTIVNPDLWELDQRYLELPGRDQVMLDLLYDYQNNVTLYPTWQEYMRTHTPPALLAWGTNDAFFPPEGARAYLDDLPDAELHLLATGPFATATHNDEIATLIGAFLDSHVVSPAPV